MAYMVMASTVTANIVMACVDMTYVVMADEVVAYIVMADVVMADVVVADEVMAYVVMASAKCRHGGTDAQRALSAACHNRLGHNCTG